MGNKASAALPPIDAISRRFNSQEAEQVKEIFQGIARRVDGGAAIPREVFMTKYGEGLGWACLRVLSKLFKVLDANGTGALEFEEYTAAVFFFLKASRAERLKVLFAMYEPLPSGLWSKADLSLYCSEATMALTERHLNDQAPANKTVVTTGRSNKYDMFPSVDSSSTPSRELSSMMADIVLIKYDADRDGKLSLSEFYQYAQQIESGADDLLDVLSTGPHIQALADALARASGSQPQASATRVAA